MHMLLLVLRMCMSIKLDMLYWIINKQDKVKGGKEAGGRSRPVFGNQVCCFVDEDQYFASARNQFVKLWHLYVCMGNRTVFVCIQLMHDVRANRCIKKRWIEKDNDLVYILFMNQVLILEDHL